MDNHIKTAFIFTGLCCLVLVESLLAQMPLLAAVSKIAASSGFLAVAYFA